MFRRRDDFYPSFYFKKAVGTKGVSMERSAGEPLRGLKIYGNGGTVTDSRNLVPYPYNSETTTISGVTVTVNENGTLTLNGTAEAQINYQITASDMTDVLDKSKTYTLSFTQYKSLYLYLRLRNNGAWVADKTTSNGVLTINMFDYTYTQAEPLRLVIPSGTVFYNTVISFQLEDGEDQTEHKPPSGAVSYDLGVGDEVVDNLIDTEKPSVSKAGVTWAVENDGKVICTGTFTAASNADFWIVNYAPTVYGDTFVLRTTPDPNVAWYYYIYDETKEYNRILAEKFIPSAEEVTVHINKEKAAYISISMHVNKQYTVSGTVMDYAAYPVVTLKKHKIPIEAGNNTADIYLTDPLRKIGEYSDVIDFARGKVIRNISEGTVLSEPTEESIDLPEITVPKGDWTLTVKTDTPPSKVEAEYYRW